MTLRDVQPLDEDQWAQLQAMFRRGPTDKSTAVIRAAMKRVDKIKQNF